MLLQPRSLTAWIAANLVASAVFLHFASWTWLEPNLRHEHVARDGDALIWMFSAFPVLLIAALANLLWFVLAGLERRNSGAPWPIHATSLVTLIWACAIGLNGLRFAGY